MSVKVIEHGEKSSEYTYKFQCRCGCKFEAQKEDGHIETEEILYLLDTVYEKWLYVKCPECGDECGVRLSRRCIAL